jgi:fructoselysine-6-P-deglycase FrlB-like protein
LNSRHSLSLVREEIERQPFELNKLLSSLRIEKARKGSIIVGTGDSYAVSLCASYLSSLRLLAMDPYVLYQSPEVAKGKDVYFVSVSGRTRANIETAKILHGICRNSIAITAGDKSSIASEVDKVIEIPYVPTKKLPGTLSFSLSLLISILLALPEVCCDFDAAYSASKRNSRRLRIADHGVTYFIGNHSAYGVAIYAAAKLYEFLGKKAHPALLEEFSHMELFSLSNTDFVNIFADADSANLGIRLRNALVKNRYSCALIESWGRNSVERVFHSIFLAQLAILRNAEVEGFSHPYFVYARKQLMISDVMIY